jgi:PAS domain S-box-containing protein
VSDVSAGLLRAVRSSQMVLAAARDEVAACRVVAEQVVEALGFEAAAVCLTTDQPAVRLAYATERWTPDGNRELQAVVGLCAESARIGQPMTRPAAAGGRRRSHVAALPLHVHERVVAVVAVGWSGASSTSGQVLADVSSITASLGPTLELIRCSRELARATRVADALSEFLGRDVRTALGESDVQDLALQLVVRVLQPESAAVWLLEPDDALRCGAAIGYPSAPDHPPVPLEERLTRQASMAVVNQADVPIGALPQPARRSYLGVPIRRHGVSLGALELVSEAGRRFRRDEEALVIGLASGMAIGVTTAREASELEQEERRFAAVLEQLPSGVMVLDTAGRPVLMNNACRRIFGRRFDRDRPVAEQTADLELRPVHTEQRQPPGILLGRVLSGEEIPAYEATFRPAGGEVEHRLLASAVPFRDASERTMGAVIVVTDITHERELAGELAATVRQNLFLHGALEESERRLQGMIERLLRPESAPRSVPDDRQLDALTRREREVLVLLGQGKSTDDMVRELQLSAGTVRLHVKHVLAKLGVSSRTQAALRAQELATRLSS